MSSKSNIGHDDTHPWSDGCSVSKIPPSGLGRGQPKMGVLLRGCRGPSPHLPCSGGLPHLLTLLVGILLAPPPARVNAGGTGGRRICGPPSALYCAGGWTRGAQRDLPTQWGEEAPIHCGVKMAPALCLRSPRTEVLMFKCQHFRQLCGGETEASASSGGG